MERSFLDPPHADDAARFAPDFGQRVLLTVDTEEEFDWSGDFSAFDYSLDAIYAIEKFQQFAEGLGAVPVWLVDWPITQSKRVQDVLKGAVAEGKAEIGIQLHPWVNPPFKEEVNHRNSYAGNLPADLERDKFLRLRDAIAENFDCDPQIYRAGRYGLGSQSAGMLKGAGVAIDTSVRANFDYSAGHGPDYSRHPLHPYWVDRERQLLELPVTSVYWGMLRRQGRLLQPLVDRIPHLGGVLSRLGLFERIALTPEGVTGQEALRGLDIAIDDGLPVIVLSFHSPSLVPGHTPYVENEEDLDRLYDWLRAVYAYCGQRGVRPTTVSEIMRSVEV